VGKVTVRARATAAPPQVTVEVVDTGPGIPPADRARIFDPFFTTKDPGQGTGLGLAICHAILESMGGEIAAGGEAGAGATFTITLRVEPGAGGPP
jgi:signal transduction histidine kinase